MCAPQLTPRPLIERAVLAARSTVTLLGRVCSRLVAQIHDELLFEVEDAQVAEFAGEPGGSGAAFIP